MENKSKAINKDIMSWTAFVDYDIIWCDPPWEQKMVNFFETILEKSGNKKPNRTIEEIINHLGKHANNEKPLFIEYSIKGHELVVDILQKRGHKLIDKVYSTQENGKPYVILVFNTQPGLIDGSCKGFKIIDSLCKNLSFKVVFDPFAGIGKTAKSFLRNNKFYIGSELNPSRFKKLNEVISNSN